MAIRRSRHNNSDGVLPRRESRSKHLRATHAGNRRVRNRLLPNENARQPRHLRHQPRRRGTQRYRQLLIRPLVHNRPFTRRHAGSKLYISKHTDNWDGLILLSSYPTADLSKTKLRVLSAYGSKDDILNLKKVESARSRVPKQHYERVIKQLWRAAGRWCGHYFR
ncbi:alpha/beta hydrolase [Bifidobacterium pseudocatenulatum]|nr:alpha/beta hydrolase [Bifidobacterium pseudocatenulatum]